MALILLFNLVEEQYNYNMLPALFPLLLRGSAIYNVLECGFLRGGENSASRGTYAERAYRYMFVKKRFATRPQISYYWYYWLE
jgi:hypothetical protein